LFSLGRDHALSYLRSCVGFGFILQIFIFFFKNHENRGTRSVEVGGLESNVKCIRKDFTHPRNITSTLEYHS